MATPRIVEHTPGAPPYISDDGNSVTYQMEIAGTQPPLRLAIRCDTQGTVGASIVSRRGAAGQTDRR